MSLTSLAICKQALNLNPSDNSQDSWISILKDSAEATIKSYCRKNFEVATYTEYYGGNERRELPLRQHPVTSLTSVFLDYYASFGDAPVSINGLPPFSATTQLIIGTDVDMDWDGDYPVGSGTRVSYNGCLLRMNSVWQAKSRSYYPLQLTPESQSSDGTIKVVYTAGYNPIPFDIQYCVALLVAYMRRTMPIGGELESERIGDYSYMLHFPRRIMPPEIGSVRGILSKYKEVVM